MFAMLVLLTCHIIIINIFCICPDLIESYEIGDCLSDYCTVFVLFRMNHISAISKLLLVSLLEPCLLWLPWTENICVPLVLLE